MKTFLMAFVIALAASTVSASLKCDAKTADVPKDWLDMSGGCVSEMRRQIQAEIDASMVYLAMGAHFAQDTINRPGFSEFFFKAAGEERDHSQKLIEYLLMRGDLQQVTDLIKVTAPTKTTWVSGVEALRDALNKESEVTKSIKRVIAKCEDDKSNNDYHLVDYLTGDFLEEQYRGQRDLAGKISTLDKLMQTQGPLGEFLFDKKLLA